MSQCVLSRISGQLPLAVQSVVTLLRALEPFRLMRIEMPAVTECECPANFLTTTSHCCFTFILEYINPLKCSDVR